VLRKLGLVLAVGMVAAVIVPMTAETPKSFAMTWEFEDLYGE
jgi:hypothetical protein